MSIFNSEAAEPSSRLAKGIAKEKELARDLRIRNPSATVTRTPQTGDGGKDLIMESGGNRIYYEVKNWERPMSVYDVRRYVKLNENTDAAVRVFNTGGFSKDARRFASEAGVKLTAGSDYTSPSGSQVARWCTNRAWSAISDSIHRTATNIARFTIRSGKVGKRLAQQGLNRTGKLAYSVGKKVYRKMSFRQIATLGIILGPIWLYSRWRNDEYSHRDLAKLIGGVLLVLVLSEIFDD